MKTIRKGDEGGDVLTLTSHLVDVGLLTKSSPVFDSSVELAVRAWQTHALDPRGRKLSVDGIVGPLTWASFSTENVRDFNPVPEDFYTIPEGGSVLGRQALFYALQEMQNGAREVGKNNAGPFVEKYHKQKMDEKQWSWCAAFTSWCFEQAARDLGQDMPFTYSVGAQNIYNQLKGARMAYEASDDYPPKPGDICVWWRGVTPSWQGHIGIVWGYRNGILYVVEGNVGPFPAPVRIYDYVLSRMDKLIGFARVDTESNQCLDNRRVEGENSILD